ncbi:metal-dependent hydrolase [Candidatus Parcubacteria bacterium]|nr:metal-dependent hydrolase [Candidatus Parcubacteria bacterium]
MDILSHALWTNLVFKELPIQQRSLAILFGVAPDLISFIAILGKGFIRKVMYYTDPPLSVFPKFVFKLYNFTHSLVIFIGIFFLLKLFQLEFLALVFTGWGLHIMLDIFTHNAKFFPTPILWPFSKFHFSGIAWSNKWFMLFNYSILMFLYFVFYFN